MSEHLQWQRETAIRVIRDDQDGENPLSLANAIARAATYVDAPRSKVEAWWRGRGQ